MEDEVLEQEPVVETPAENVQEQVETAPENVQEEPTTESEPVEEPVVEQPVAEPQPAPEPLQINTHGQWELLEHFMQQELEIGKTYRISVAGHCQFMISADKPTVGMTTNEITYTKQEGQNLWIKTGE